MSEPTKRHWFQIHLSTAVVLMITAGGGMWANFHEYMGNYYPVHGWPIPYDPEIGNFSEAPINIGYLIADILFWLAILTFLAIMCEWRIRRKEDAEAEFRESIG